MRMTYNKIETQTRCIFLSLIFEALTSLPRITGFTSPTSPTSFTALDRRTITITSLFSKGGGSAIDCQKQPQQPCTPMALDLSCSARKTKNEAQMCTAISTILNIWPANAMTRKKKTMDVHHPMAILFRGKNRCTFEPQFRSLASALFVCARSAAKIFESCLSARRRDNLVYDFVFALREKTD